MCGAAPVNSDHFREDLISTERALARARFWGGLASFFTLGAWTNANRIIRAESHVSSAHDDLRRFDELQGDIRRLHEFLDESIEEQGVRVALCLFPDLALAGQQTYGPFWDEIRKAVLDRDGYSCQHADGRCQGPLQAHHIRPLSKGGTNELVNLITVCRFHHGLQHPHNPAFHRLVG
jgi:hypothetical protein